MLLRSEAFPYIQVLSRSTSTFGRRALAHLFGVVPCGASPDRTTKRDDVVARSRRGCGREPHGRVSTRSRRSSSDLRCARAVRTIVGSASRGRATLSWSSGAKRHVRIKSTGTNPADLTTTQGLPCVHRRMILAAAAFPPDSARRFTQPSLPRRRIEIIFDLAENAANKIARRPWCWTSPPWLMHRVKLRRGRTGGLIPWDWSP